MNHSEINLLFDKLWPICRSITGPGITKSLKIIQKYVPIKIVEIPSGTKVFDWKVPQEWKLNRATLHTEDGKLIIDSKNSNIHVVNFSKAFKGLLSYNELEQHLYSYKNLPSAIPYVTSYYAPRWGLCLSEKQKVRLSKNKKYRVNIDTETYNGSLRYGDCVLKGKSKKTILISTYLCHPSMANNELSGPLVWAAIYNKIAQNKERYFTYRFVIVPETIGSISFLSKTSKKKLDEIYSGIVLTCLGGPSKSISFKHSRRHWLGQESDIDNFVESLCQHDSKTFKERRFTPASGSDERQFCSPGINLPFIQIAKTIYNEYDQYHTSLDNKKFMSINSVMDSIEKIYFFLTLFEKNRSNLISQISGKGEPMLGKRGLYPTINSPLTRNIFSNDKVDSREQLNLLMNTISLLDGNYRLSEIVKFLKSSYSKIYPIINKLQEKKVIKNK